MPSTCVSHPFPVAAKVEPSDSLKITWAANSPNGIASQTVQIDGATVTPISRPYGGLYYSCQIGKRGLGIHWYKITVTDKQKHTSSASGTFSVVPNPPPSVSSVIVCEAVPQDHVLESNESLKITWAATSSLRITAETVTVDGTTITAIGGPYGGLYYRCIIGMWSAGAHSYVITATNSQGFSLNSLGTFTIAAALTVDAGTAPHSSASVLTNAELASIAAEAIQRLESQLGSQVETAMAGVSVKVANLPSGVLGETSGKTIWIDDDGAGYGWFVDPTPAVDEEFAPSGSNYQLQAIDPRAVDRIDLLTVVEHELGHVLGLPDLGPTSDGVMDGVLGVGVRRDSSHTQT